MYTSSIKISELDNLNVISSVDFFPIVESGSLTTYRTDITTLNEWMAASGSALSASWAPMPGVQISCSWASSSLRSNTASLADRALLANTSTNQSGGYIIATNGRVDGLLEFGRDGVADPIGTPNGILLRGGINDGAFLFVSGSSDNGALYIRTSDNGNEPIFIQTVATGNSASNRIEIRFDDIGDINGISNSTRMKVNGVITASYYSTTASANTVGFIGTASWASQSLYSISASYVPPTAVINDTLPVGTIIAYSGETAPNNWLECNGELKLIADYSDLYTAISSSNPNATYGYSCDSYGNRAGAPKTYFKLPDFRGEFLRGWDHLRGVDSGREQKSYQSPSAGEHWHGVGGMTAETGDNGRFISRGWNDGNTYSAREIDGSGGGTFTISNPSYPLGTSNPVGNTDNVYPRNISVMYLIKYSNASNYANLTGVTLAGDVQGNYAATTVTGIQNIPVTSSAPSNDQVLAYNTASNMWAPKSLTLNSFIKAFGTFYSVGHTNGAIAINNFIPFSGSYNFISASAQGSAPQIAGNDGMKTSSLYPFASPQNDYQNDRQWIFHMETPLPSTNYTVIGSIIGEQRQEASSMLNFPLSGRSLTGFTMSFSSGGSVDWSADSDEIRWVSVMVLHV